MHFVLISLFLSAYASTSVGRADLSKVSVQVSDRATKVGFGQLTTPEQYFHAVWTLEADVNNGGFDQYFFNSSGDYAFVAPTALRTIGAHQAAALVERAAKVFGDGGPPKDRSQRQAAMTKLPGDRKKTWEELDKKFFAYPDDIAAMLEAYVAANGPSFK